MVKGFVDPNGKWLTRIQASHWVKQHQPEAYAKLSGQAKLGLHTQDYNEAVKEEPTKKRRKVSE